MHKISEQSMQAAQRHALIARKHGNSIQACARALQRWNDTHTLEDHSQFIEEYGETVKIYAEKSLMYAQLLQEQDVHSTKVYGLAVKSHVNATQAHIQAVKMYTQRIQELLKARRNC